MLCNCHEKGVVVSVDALRRDMGFGWGGGAPSYNISWWQRSPILPKPQRISAPAGLKSTAAK